MTNNNDDFEHHDLGPTEELPAPNGGLRSNLAEAWRSRPLFKLIVLMTAVAAIVAASVSFLSGGSSSQTASRLVNPPGINAPPGGPASPYMQEQTNLASQDREKTALQTGGSALPTPIGQVSDLGALNASERKSDPLNELKNEVERLRQEQKQVQQQQVQVQQQIQQPRQQEPFDDSLATAMQRQMSQLIESWTPTGAKQVLVMSPDDLKNYLNEKKGKQTAAGGTASTTDAAATAAQTAPKTLVSAGTVSYAQLLTEANSDVPGPILAQIVSGPFSGARAIGQFQVANGYADYLVLQFTLVNFKGKDYSINAVALDPDTTLGGMATEVDQRYFTRVLLPAAAGFLQGFGQAIGQNSSTTTTNGTSTIISQGKEGYQQGMFQGLGAAAQTASQFFQNQANQTKPLVRVAAGTPMGLFFVTSATDMQTQPSPYAANVAGAGYPPGLSGFGGSYQGASSYPGAPYGLNPMGGPTYPGMTVAGYGAQPASNVPYPNYGNTAAPYGASPYSAFPTGLSPGLGTTTYGR